MEAIVTHQPCPSCGSSDGLAQYEDHDYCFACKTYVSHKQATQFLPWRCITADTMMFFDVKTVPGEKIMYPYRENSKKVRSLKEKNFWFEGDNKNLPLFGQDKFNAGQAKAITITEGELDTLSVFQMLGSKYPVVSVWSSATARKDCERARDYLNSFEKIYLCFDNDNPGQTAANEVAMLFDVNKIYRVSLDRFKDPNEFLCNNAEKEFVSVWYNSKRYRPKGIVSDWDQIEEILNKQSETSIASYPFPTLEEMTYGIRSKEVVLFTAPEKIGKTETFRAIEYHLLKETDYNIGIIHLEEQEKRTIDGIVTYELKSPVHLPDSTFTAKEKFEAYKAATKSSDRVHFYSHFGSEDPDVILDVVRALVTQCGCKFIFLDHITMVVTGSDEDNERKALDYISTRLAMMTRELDFTLFMISHVNDNGQTRGSRNIAKVADLIIHLSRDVENPDAGARNTTNVLVKGNRFCANSGPSAPLLFDIDTYTLAEKLIYREGELV